MILNTDRVNFSSIKSQMPYPDFLEIQLKSFHDFFQLDTAPEQRKNEGLHKVFLLMTQGITSSSNFSTILLSLRATPLRNA